MKIRWAVIGLGIQGTKRARLLKSKVVATVDPVNLDANVKTLEDLDIDFDIAAICVPDPIKAQVALKILRMGKSCLIEKPYPVFSQAEELEASQIIQDKNVFLYTAYNHRFEPAIIELKSIVQLGKIGEPFFSSFRYGNGTLDDRIKTPWKASSASLAFDLGSHLLDIYEYIFSEFPINLHIDQSIFTPNLGQSYLRFSSQNAIFETSYFFWKSDFHIKIYGSEGSIFLEGLQKWGQVKLTLHSRVYPSGAPIEKSWTYEGADPTWESEHQIVEEMFLGTKSRGNTLKDFQLNQLIVTKLSENKVAQ
jgi:predicted dehydrogenase